MIAHSKMDNHQWQASYILYYNLNRVWTSHTYTVKWGKRGREGGVAAYQLHVHWAERFRVDQNLNNNKQTNHKYISESRERERERGEVVCVPVFVERLRF